MAGPDVPAVTPRVWSALLALRAAHGAAETTEWTAGEEAGFALYSSLLEETDRPFVVAQVGQSLDGRVGTPAGDCRDISGSGGLVHLHRLRALADVVVVGAGTILADDPRLTVRLTEGPDPARAAVDPSGRVPAAARIWDDGRPRIAIQTVAAARPGGVETIRMERGAGGGIAPAEILAALAERGYRRILVEGGARTIGGFLEAGLVDRLHVCVAPLIVGSGPSSFALPPISKLGQAMRPSTRLYALGTDILFDCDLRG